MDAGSSTRVWSPWPSLPVVLAVVIAAQLFALSLASALGVIPLP